MSRWARGDFNLAANRFDVEGESRLSIFFATQDAVLASGQAVRTRPHSPTVLNYLARCRLIPPSGSVKCPSIGRCAS